MNIKAITCPNCGASLNVENINQSLFYCQYCGAAVQLETNRNKGYDMEHGRLDARAELADSILERIDKIKDALIRNGRADYDIKYYPHIIAEQKAELSFEFWDGLKHYVLKGFLKGLGVLFIGAIFVVALTKALPAFLLTLLELAVLLAPVYFPIIGIVIVIKKQIEIKSYIADCETRIKKATKELRETNEFLAKNAEVDIPQRFRQERALNYMIKGLKAREFVSLEQALFRCEEAMTRGEVADNYIEF
ncbi:MAG: zinc ribbon domain-containing protein [Lachnospiraceae bacterium]|nr:zinc ribbon domain-containing protein [Lachnospiraceae bacterium]